MHSTVNSIFVFPDLRYQIISFGLVLTVNSNIFLCCEICSCSPLSFEKGSTVLCCKVLQLVSCCLFGGG